MNLVSVEQAEEIIQAHCVDFGTENIYFENALGRILAENLFADRDLPPFNRATVDGIAINFNAYQNGLISFDIKSLQVAGDEPKAITNQNECIEIMTGAALDNSLDTVVRYEDVEIINNTATIKIETTIKQHQNIHFKGIDKKEGDIVANNNSIITPALIGVAASIGKINLLVKKLPRIIIVSTGDEMIDIAATPTPYQLRRSNGMVIKFELEKYKINADILHLNDDIDLIRKELNRCIEEYDVLLMSGGVSMGKFDFIPQVLEEIGVQKKFHKVQQRPGKPFWFGTNKNNKTIFAFPGNPVSVFMCLHRYFIPWLKKCLSINSNLHESAILQNDIKFTPLLQYFIQVKLHTIDAKLFATPLNTNGSGDFSQLIFADAFMELPLEKSEFKKDEVYKIWRY